MTRNFTPTQKSAIDRRQHPPRIGMTGVMKMRLLHLTLALAFLTAPSAFGQSMPSWKSATQTGNLRDLVLSAGSDNSVAAWFGKKVDVSSINRPRGIAGLDADAALSDSPKRIHLFMSSARTGDLPYLMANADLLVNSGVVSLGTGVGFVGITAQQQAQLDAYWKYSNLKFSTGGGGETISELDTRVFSGPNDDRLGRIGGAIGEEVEANLYDTGAGNSSYTDPKSGVVYGCYATADDLAKIKASVDSDFQYGAKNYGVTSAPNCGTEDFSQPFATGDYWANVRAMALYGGAIVLDASPTIFFNHPTPAGMPGNVATEYPDMVAQMIVWAKKQGLRTNITMSPLAAHTDLDVDMLAATKSMVDYLRSKGAVPAEFLVDQYNWKPDSGTNGPWGDYVPNSLNQVVLYLMTVNTPDAGSTYPQAHGGLPGNQLMKGNLRFVAQKQVPDKSGSMGEESVNDVRIHGGQIGDTYSNASGIHITLMAAGGSSFSTQVPLLFQGANGNPDLRGGTNDGYLHLDNAFVGNNAEVGFVLGLDSAAPGIIRDGTKLNMKSASQIEAQSAFLQSGLTLYSSYTPASPIHPSIYAGTKDHFVHIGSDFTNDSQSIGLAFDTQTSGGSFASLVGISGNAGISYTGRVFQFSNMAQLGNMTKAEILASPYTWNGMMVNDSDDHVPVVYENGHWYPMTLGPALQ